jgi:hypothetical protein
MLKHTFLSLMCVGAVGVCVAVGQTGMPIQNGTDATAAKVNLRSVVKVFLTNNIPGYSIAYEYDFPQRRSVYIKGFGTVPAKGSFRYLTSATQLEIRDSPEGQVLAQVPLHPTVIVAARAPLLPTPEVADFPADFKTFVWESPKTLQERAEIVLNKYFHLAPNSDCEKGTVYVRTTYTPLELQNSPVGVTAQVALLLSFPCDPGSGKYSFQVKSRVMEGRTHSDEFRSTKDSDIVRAADNFVQSLVEEMKGRENGNP